MRPSRCRLCRTASEHHQQLRETHSSDAFGNARLLRRCIAVRNSTWMGACVWPMIDNSLLLELRSDPLPPTELFRCSERDPVGMEFELRRESFAQDFTELGFVKGIGLLDVEN